LTCAKTLLPSRAAALVVAASLFLPALVAAQVLFPFPTVTSPIPVAPSSSKIVVDSRTGNLLTIPATTANPVSFPMGGQRLRLAPPGALQTAVFDASRLLADGQSTWMIDRGARRVVRINNLNGWLEESISLGPAQDAPTDFILDGPDTLWIGTDYGRVLRWQRGLAIQEIMRSPWPNTAIRGTIRRLAVAGDTVFALATPVDASWDAGTLTLFHRVTGARTFELALYSQTRDESGPLSGATVYGQVVSLQVRDANSALLVYSTGATFLFRRDSQRIMEQLLPPDTAGVVDALLADDVLWSLNATNGTLRRFHLGTRQMLAALAVGPGGEHLLHTGRTLWVKMPDRLIAVNPFDGTLAPGVTLPQPESDLTWDGTRLISVGKGTGLLRRR
jgi:hypothetical protein